MQGSVVDETSHPLPAASALEDFAANLPEYDGSTEEKKEAALAVYHDLWVSNVIGEHALIRQKDSKTDPELVLRAGPFSVLTISLAVARANDTDGVFILTHNTQEKTVSSLEAFELAPAEPVANANAGQLGFRAAGDFLPITQFVAQHGIQHLAPGILLRLMAKLKIRGAQKLTHRLRVELFLKTMECTQEYIDTVLALIPEKPPRKRKENTAEDDPEQKDRF